MDPNHSALMDKVVEKLKAVYDPEIPVDIYELGLIYDVRIDNKKISLLEIPTGNPLVINLNPKLKIIECKYLDKDRAKDLLTF